MPQDLSISLKLRRWSHIWLLSVGLLLLALIVATGNLLGLTHTALMPSRQLFETEETIMTQAWSGNTSSLAFQEKEQVEARRRFLLQFRAPPKPNTRKVILLGPHDRYNFGDLIFEKVVSYLLQEVAGYTEQDMVPAGMISVNMSQYGGNERIVSSKKALEMSQNWTNLHKDPFNAVFLGGESLYCDKACGSNMQITQEYQEQAMRDAVVDCAYYFPKALLLPPHLQANSTASGIRQPVLVANSVNRLQEGAISECSQIVTNDVDVVNFRDLEPNRTLELLPKARGLPDSAVMTSFLFHDLIRRYGTKGEVAEVRGQYPKGYLAVQMNEVWMKKHTHVEVAGILDEIHSHTQLSIVFFCAGTVPFHDNADVYREVAAEMKSPNRIFLAEHVWKVVALIRYASAVIGTSLHVRIMAFVHARPRITWCEQVDTGKQFEFIRIWESEDSTPCIFELNETLPALRQALETPPDRTLEAQRAAIRLYMEGFREWSTLLNK